LAVAQSMNAEVTGLAGVDLSYIEEPMQRDGGLPSSVRTSAMSMWKKPIG